MAMQQFEMTKCTQCGSEMLMGLTVCPSCGQKQKNARGGGAYQPRTLLAVMLAAAILFIFNWFKSAPTGQVTSPPSATLPSR